MDDDSKPATEGASPAHGPVPNTVCHTCEFYAGAMDALAYDPRTQFRNGTCLCIDAEVLGPHYGFSICADKHVHLKLGMEVEIGTVSAITVAAYALALSYDREGWVAGFVPGTEQAKSALRDCIAVLRTRTPNTDFADWLAKHSARDLSRWIKEICKAVARVEDGKFELSTIE